MIRKWKRETDTKKPKLENFCFCLSLYVGAHVIFFIHLTFTIFVSVGLSFWIITAYIRSDCFGPVYVDFVENKCESALKIQQAGFGIEFETIDDELQILSAHFQVLFLCC